jgi:hypothetical protein
MESCTLSYFFLTGLCRRDKRFHFTRLGGEKVLRKKLVFLHNSAWDIFPAAAQHKLISNTTETRRRFHQPEKEICGRDFRPRDVVALCHQRTTTPISFVSFVSQQEKQTSSFWLARLFAVFQ